MPDISETIYEIEIWGVILLSEIFDTIAARGLSTTAELFLMVRAFIR